MTTIRTVLLYHPSGDGLYVINETLLEPTPKPSKLLI